MRRRYVVALGLAGAIVGTDQITKRYAADQFAAGDVTVIPGFLSFTFTENPGAAFSLFQNAGPILGVAAIVVSVIVLIALRGHRTPLETVALGLVMGGAIGNLADRVVRGDGLLDGHVIDWINLWWIPTFNVADAAVTTAVALMLIHAWRTR